MKPGIFQPDDLVNPDHFHFGHTHMTYRDFIKEEEKKANFKCPVVETLKKKQHPFLQIPNLLKCGYMKCPGCGNVMINCHDVVFGLYCAFEVIDYCADHIEHVDDVIVKKIFIDTYNRCLRFVMFREKAGYHNEWVFPPLCMQNNSYTYILYWYECIVKGDRDLGFSSSDEEKF